METIKVASPGLQRLPQTSRSKTRMILYTRPNIAKQTDDLFVDATRSLTRAPGITKAIAERLVLTILGVGRETVPGIRHPSNRRTLRIPNELQSRCFTAAMLALGLLNIAFQWFAQQVG
ncbi:MAG: hypothetical protein CMJ80_07260 [Planctomycetaceae bacterium]|nr:hypothetical protein [Planctomycetaceae bacterium]